MRSNSSAGRFWEPGVFAKYLTESSERLARLYGNEIVRTVFERAPVVIAAYSGGYHPLAFILKSGAVDPRLRGVILLDAPFGDQDKFADWLGRKPQAFFLSVYGKTARDDNALLQKLLTDRGVGFQTELPTSLAPNSVTFVDAPDDVKHVDFVTEGWGLDPLKTLLRRISGFSRTSPTSPELNAQEEVTRGGVHRHEIIVGGHAFDQRREHVVGHAGHKTYVVGFQRGEKCVGPVDRHKTSAQKPALEISHYARRVLGEPSVPMPNARPFALHTPDPALFPRAQLARLVMEEFRRPPQEAQTTQYGDCKRFQAAVAAYLRHASGVHCEPQQVIAVSGHEAALALTARVLIDPGHRVLVQDPSILAARAMFADAGARIEALPVDAKGADPKTISGPPPRLIWVSPALSFPLGVQMTEARRLAVLDAARHAGAAIFESSSYGDLVYSGHRLRAIQGHDNEGRVIYYGSFQRTLGPGMRLGYLIVPPALVDAFCKMRRRIAGGPELFLQSAMATFIGENRYALHLKKVRGIYAGRLRMLMAACRKHIPQASFTEPVGGFHLALNFSDGTDEQRVYAAAAKDGFQVQPLSQFYQDPRNGTGLVLGFGAMADAFIEPAIVRLAASIREAAPPH